VNKAVVRATVNYGVVTSTTGALKATAFLNGICRRRVL